MLLNDYLPEFDVRANYATRIAASPASVYASLWTVNFDHWGVTRALYAVRTLQCFWRDRVRHGAASVTSCFGSALLSTACSRKASLWLRSARRRTRARHSGSLLACPGRTVRNQPSSFRAPAPAGTAKAAWNFWQRLGQRHC